MAKRKKAKGPDISAIFEWASKGLNFLGIAADFVAKIQASINEREEAKRVLHVRATNYGMQSDKDSLQAYYESMAQRNVDDGTANAVLREIKLQMADKGKFKEEMEKLGIKDQDFDLLKDSVAVFAKIMERAEAAEDVTPFLKYIQEKLKIKNDELLFMFTDTNKQQDAFKQQLEDWKSEKELDGILQEREKEFVEAVAKRIRKRKEDYFQEAMNEQQPQLDIELEKIRKDWKDPKNRKRIREEYASKTPNSAPSPAAQEPALKAPAAAQSLPEGPHQIRMPVSNAPHPDFLSSGPASLADPSAIPPGDSTASTLKFFVERVSAWAESAAGDLDRIEAASASLPAQVLPVVSASSSRMLAKLDEILGYAKEPRAEYAITVNSNSQELPQAGDALGWQGWAAATASGTA